jgi:uncharacterized protein with PIN domain
MPVNVTFRFYEELKDFLPKDKRSQPFAITLKGNPSVKDTIEALGIPHTEVDLILVNSQPVEFSYKLKDKDYVSVYPVFESLDISDITSLRNNGLRNPKFVLDTHLGRLARYLRLLGFDTIYSNDFEDNEIIKISLDDNRIILTRDKGILKNNSVTHGYYIRSQKPKEQINEVIIRFHLESLVRPFTVCSLCNGKIVSVSKDSVTEHLKSLTKKHYNRFYMCSECKKIYWEGSHYKRIKNFISGLNFNNDKSPNT